MKGPSASQVERAKGLLAAEGDWDTSAEATGLGVTVMATVELADSYVDLRFSPQGIAFLTDAIIIQRYIEIDGGLRRGMAVVKLRASQHSKELREYDITSDGGIAVGKALKGYRGLLTGSPSMNGKGRKR